VIDKEKRGISFKTRTWSEEDLGNCERHASQSKVKLISKMKIVQN
jgi:hypothetical protein